jgi:protein TonB
MACRAPTHRPPASGAWRALWASSAVHATLIGAGLALGVLAGGERRPLPVYTATFAPPHELAFEPPEREELELAPPRASEVEPELRESEVWAEQDELFAFEASEPDLAPRARTFEWVDGPPLAIGTLAPAPVPAPAPPEVFTPAPLVPAGPRVAEPVALATPSPSYPRVSRRAGEEGSVLCRLHLALDGRVTAVDVVESSGFPRLDEAASAALADWRFEPRREDGRAVAATLLHRVTFRLREG